MKHIDTTFRFISLLTLSIFSTSLVFGATSSPAYSVPSADINSTELSTFEEFSTRRHSVPTASIKPTSTSQLAGDTNWLTRSTLTGDWGGARSSISDNGVTLDLRHTSTYQGLVAGTGDKEFELGNKVDAFIILNSEKMGLWEGGGFVTHLDYRYGDAPSTFGGAIFATNAMLYWPGNTTNELEATSLFFTQKISDKATFAIGKFNPVDTLASSAFYGGWGIDRFMNLILVAPPSGLIPVVFMGAVASIKTEPVSWTLMIYDPEDRTFDYAPDDLFETGVTAYLSGSHATMLAGRKTTYIANFLYSTAEGTDYSMLEPGIGTTTTKSGAYNFSVEFKHALQEEGKADWGFYLKAAIADGNPNYVQSSLIVGIGGKALFFDRPQDSFGVGAYYYNLSDHLEDTGNPFNKFGDESAIEAYYNYAVKPWMLVGPDIQLINPASGRSDNAFVASLRLEFRL